MKSTFMDKLEDVLLPIADKLNNNKYLASLRDGFYGCTTFNYIWFYICCNC